MDDDLYNGIDDEDMSDEDKREAYFSEVENEEAESEWQDSH